LEQAFRGNDKVAVDSMLNSWYAQSVIKKHGSSVNDTIEFVYDIYTRFTEDYIHKKMTGKKGIPVNGNYVFIQDKRSTICLWIAFPSKIFIIILIRYLSITGYYHTGIAFEY
jgi:hypothetical protein